MAVFPFLAVSFIMKVFAVLFIICSVALILVVLIQKGRGGGLSGAFGGAMASGILGSKTGDFLTWVTIILVGVFLTIAVVMAKYYKPPEVGSGFGTVQPPQATTQQQPIPVDSTETTTSGTSDSNATGGLGSAQPELPAVEEQVLPVQGAEPETGDSNLGNDVNLPGN